MLFAKKMEDCLVVGQVGGVERHNGCHFGFDTRFAAAYEPSWNAKQARGALAQQKTESVMEGIRFDQGAVQIYAERNSRRIFRGGDGFERCVGSGFQLAVSLLPWQDGRRAQIFVQYSFWPVLAMCLRGESRGLYGPDMHWVTPEERHELGQKRRKHCARQQHTEFSAKARLTPPLTLLQRSVRGRVPALVKIKYERMMASPFGYFRGAVPVMAADLATMPNTGLMVQLCGDAHVRNLGAYAAEDGRLIFDINDFDETFRGPFEWDLKRMAASLVVAGRESGNKDAACTRAVVRLIASYCEQMREYAPMPVLDMVRDQISRLEKITPVHLALQKALRATPMHTLEQLTAPVPGQGSKMFSKTDPKTGSKTSSNTTPDAPRQFKEIKPVLTRLTGDKAKVVLASLEAYKKTLQSQRQYFFSQYRPLDVAFKVVGTGSVGLRDYCVYMEGNGPGDPFFLQIKEEAQSAYAPYLQDRRVPKHQGQRVVEGQRLIQTGTDILLGYTTIDGRDYLVRRLNDHKASIELGDLNGDGLLEYAALCGELLARGHARSGDAQEISGYLGSGARFAEAIAEFGHKYADQTEKDWAELKRARK